jgi:hypothetical protein
MSSDGEWIDVATPKSIELTDWLPQNVKGWIQSPLRHLEKSRNGSKYDQELVMIMLMEAFAALAGSFLAACLYILGGIPGLLLSFCASVYVLIALQSIDPGKKTVDNFFARAVSFVKSPEGWHQRWVLKKHLLRLVRIAAVAASATVLVLLLHHIFGSLFVAAFAAFMIFKAPPPSNGPAWSEIKAKLEALFHI